tara:strand:- start:515 stop:1123 length:609 start_codon:yes stop_codon:yes gene_type:complete
MWVLKLGGSWLKNRKLNDLLQYLILYNNSDIVLVVGGGIFADAVRLSQKFLKFDDQFANYLAIKATENYAESINSVFPEIRLTKNLNELKKKDGLKIWLPGETLNNESTFTKNWNSTSDSIACWLGRKISAKGVIFVKSLNFEKNQSFNLRDLQNKGILDENISNYINKNTCLKIVGPEIINKMRKFDKISNYFMKLKSIEL